MNFKLNIIVCCVLGRVPWFEAGHPYSRVGEELGDVMAAITAEGSLYLPAKSIDVTWLLLESGRQGENFAENFYLVLREKLLACGPLHHGWSTGSVSTTC